MTGAAQRHFLFLQGGFSDFLNRVGTELQGLGHQVTGVNFCAGDLWLWRDKPVINYRGRLRDWPAFISDYLDRAKVTDLVLLGEQRDYHKEAVAAALERGIQVTVTDFGYLRPDWITLERNGMSGNSLFPRDPAQIRQLAAALPAPDLERKFLDSTWNMGVGDITYSFANVLLWFLYPHYRRSDHRANPIRFFPALALQQLIAGRRDRQAREVFAGLKREEGRYFLFPMQLDHDFQITAYSPFHDMNQAIRLVFASFAAHAPDTDKLLLKIHPWDPGFKNWPRLIRRWSSEFGISDRVLLVRGGHLDDMIGQAQGVVTVNSTTGVRALQLGCPLCVLGQAIYDLPGLVHQGKLDDFWGRPQPPDARLVEDFIRAIAGTIQIRGVYYNEPGLGHAVGEAVRRLHQGTVGQPEVVRSNPAISAVQPSE